MAHVVICGYMVRYPVPGLMMAYFHYLVGLRRLGHEVLYLEESGWPGSCYDPIGRRWQDDPRAGLALVGELMRSHGVDVPLAYVDRGTGKSAGMPRSQIAAALADADLLLNLGGVCWLPEFHSCRRRALVDMDPLFTQAGKFGGGAADQHHVHFTYGMNIGRPGCTIPTVGIRWRPTPPPVVIDLWERGSGVKTCGAMDRALESLTTIANWGAYGAITCNGERYGQKDEEFLRLLDLPRRTSRPLELALEGAPVEVRQRLREAGWRIRDGGQVSVDLPTYMAYVTGSWGEFSAAKNAYVKTRSGWFSDRTVCYLAAGRPAIVQDTGQNDWLRTGRGVLTFSTVEEAAQCIEQVGRDYEGHCAAAKEIARSTFAHDVVLPRLLDTAMSLRD